MDFSQVYDEFFPRIYAYIRCRTSCDAAAEDIASGVFQKALAKSAQYDSRRGSMAQWLFGIARNEVNYHLRKSAIWHFLSLENFEMLADKHKPVLDSISSDEEKAALLSALEKLDARSRDIVTLKFYSEMTNREIARITGLTESNAGTILYRCMAELRRHLAGGANDAR